MSWLTDHFSVPMIIVFVGAVISFIGAGISAIGVLWSSSDRMRYERDLRLKSEELAAKSDQIAALNQQIMGSVTGGESFCYIDFLFGNPTSNVLRLIVLQEGEHPLYDVTVRIVDLEKLDSFRGKITWEAMQQTDTNLSIGNMPPGGSWISGPWQLPTDKDQQRYNLFISARNGALDELVRLRRVDGKWIRAIKVRRLIGREYGVSI